MHLDQGTDEIRGNQPCITSSQSSSIWQNFCTKSDMIEIIIAPRTVQDKGEAAEGDGVEGSTQLFQDFFFFLSFLNNTLECKLVPSQKKKSTTQLFSFHTNLMFSHVFLFRCCLSHIRSPHEEDTLPDPFHTSVLFASR